MPSFLLDRLYIRDKENFPFFFLFLFFSMLNFSSFAKGILSWNFDTILGATLHFEVELINISDSPPTANVFKEIDSDKDNMLSREEVRTMARYLFFSFLYSGRLGAGNLHRGYSFNPLKKLQHSRKKTDAKKRVHWKNSQESRIKGTNHMDFPFF